MFLLSERTLTGEKRPLTPNRALSVWSRFRVEQWLHFVVLPVAAWDLTAISAHEVWALGRGMVVAGCVLAYGYLVNALADREMDRDSAKNPFVVARQASMRGWLFGFPIAAIGMAVTISWTSVLATIVALTCGTVYSIGPRLKTLPFIGSLLNIGNFTPLMFVGMASPAMPPGLLGLVTSFSLLLVQNQLLHEAADAAEDRRGHCRTTFLLLGPVIAGALAALAGASLVAVLGAPGEGFWRILWQGLAFAVFGIAFPLLLAMYGLDGARMARIRRVHRLASMVGGLILYYHFAVGR